MPATSHQDNSVEVEKGCCSERCIDRRKLSLLVVIQDRVFHILAANHQGN